MKINTIKCDLCGKEAQGDNKPYKVLVQKYEEKETTTYYNTFVKKQYVTKARYDVCEECKEKLDSILGGASND